jgi:hypothetical protein
MLSRVHAAGLSTVAFARVRFTLFLHGAASLLPVLGFAQPHDNASAENHVHANQICAIHPSKAGSKQFPTARH